MAVLKTYVALFAFLLLAFSAVQVGLSAYALHFSRSHRHGSPNSRFDFYTTATNLHYQFYWLPNHVLNRSYALQVATGALGFVVGLFVLVISVTRKPFSFTVTGRNAPRKFAWTSISVMAAVFFLLLAIPSLIVTFYDFTHHAQRQVEYMTVCLATLSNGSSCTSSYAAGWAPWTIEGWICLLWDTYENLQSRLSPDAPAILNRTCRVTMTAKWWTIPMLILPFAIILFAVLDKRDQNIRKYHAGRTVGAKESSFSSDDSPTVVAGDAGRSPVSPMSPNVTGSELQGDYKPSVETTGKQLYEVPGKHHDAGYEEMAAAPHQMYSELAAAKSKEQVK